MGRFILVIVLITVLVLTTAHSRELPYKRSDEWYRNASKKKFCSSLFCWKDKHCCPGDECWLVPGTCIKPTKETGPGYCTAVQIQC